MAMSELNLSISVAGLALPQWEQAFRTTLLAEPDAKALALAPVRSAGTLGARRSSAIKVKGAAGTDGADATIKLVGIVLSALSLAVASAQLAIATGDRPAVQSAITCTIEGPDGTRELRIENAGIVPESLLRDCLKSTGTPSRIQARADATPR
ncbi:hypothetical protein CEW87_20345 [Parazoarcus communis]|uniref:Uncharacterized protein n=2 Tax=Parazoarcus communis TaxID=41977 RepID=A0A2U8H6P0_9RHOO|nr:hypothetical protein CEW87_20345 [Parazoarcus communis]